MLACRVRVIARRFFPVLSHVLYTGTYGDTARYPLLEKLRVQRRGTMGDSG